jgi:hypothetical protein
VRSKREALYALLVISFVWTSLFGHWLPMFHSLLFDLVLLLELAMIVAGWWCWIKGRKDEGIAVWRKGVGLLGIAAYTTALIIPAGSLRYMMYYPFIRARMRLPMVDAKWLILTVLGFSLLGLIAGILAPPRSRFATALGGLIIGSIVLSIPIGIP